MNISMASTGGPDQGHPYGLQARDINIAHSCCRTKDIYMNLELQQDLEHQITDIKVASRESTDHRGLLRRLNPKNKSFFILDICLLLRSRAIMQLGSMLGA